jgi:hypothetical protein
LGIRDLCGRLQPGGLASGIDVGLFVAAEHFPVSHSKYRVTGVEHCCCARKLPTLKGAAQVGSSIGIGVHLVEALGDDVVETPQGLSRPQ